MESKREEKKRVWCMETIIRGCERNKASFVGLFHQQTSKPKLFVAGGNLAVLAKQACLRL